MQEIEINKSLTFINDLTTNINENDLKNIVCKMVLLFNLFEAKFANSNSSIQQIIKSFLDPFDPEEINCDYCFKFFEDRYIENDETNDKFNNNLFRDGESEKKRKNEIKQNLLKGKNKLYTCLSIAYRFRNNLFHGNKAVFQVEQDKNCFQQINSLLENVLKNHKEENNG